MSSRGTRIAATSTLLCTTGTGVVDDDLPHDGGGDAEEMEPVLPGEIPTSDQFQEGFMDQVGRRASFGRGQTNADSATRCGADRRRQGE